MLRRTLAVFCFAAACSSEPSKTADDPTDVRVATPPSSTATAAPLQVSSAPTAELPSVLASFQLPQKTGADLGAPCPPPAPDTELETCGSAGRVSIEVRNKALMGPPPCPLVEVFSADKIADRRTGCIDGDHMLLNSVCLVCRLPNVGTAVHAKMSELTPEQTKRLVTIFQLPSTPSSPTEWRALLRKNEPQ